MSYGFFSILSIVFYQLLWSRMEVRFSVLRYYILHFNQYYVQLMSLSFLIIFFPIWLRCETYFQAISFIDRYLSLFFSVPICVVSTSLFAQWRVYFNHSFPPLDLPTLSVPVNSQQPRRNTLYFPLYFPHVLGCFRRFKADFLPRHSRHFHWGPLPDVSFIKSLSEHSIPQMRMLSLPFHVSW